MNFNDGTLNADMANGKGEPAKVKKPAKFIEKGLFGKGLADGWINYDAKQNIDLTVPGTLIYWVAPTWDSKKPANGKEPGFTALQIRGKSKEYNYTMISGKMHGQPWGHGHFNTYVQYPGAKIKHVNCENMNVARAGIWKNGQWKMKAITWNGGKFAVSVNGSPSKSSTLKKMMIGETVYMELGVGGGKQIMCPPFPAAPTRRRSPKAEFSPKTGSNCLKTHRYWHSEAAYPGFWRIILLYTVLPGQRSYPTGQSWK